MTEMSTVSEVQSEVSEVESGFEQSTTGGDKESQRSLLLPVAAVCCLVLLVLGIVSAVSLFGSSEAVDPEAGGGGGDGKADSGDAKYSKSSQPGPQTARTSKTPPTGKAATTPTMKPTTLKTTEAKTAPSATRTPKKPPTTTKKPPTTTKKPPTTTKKPPTTPKVTTTTTRMLPELLCTVGDLAVLPAMYPYDGMCDYIFYTNVYIYNGQLTSTRVLRSFELFKAKTKKYSQTKGGVSFDIRYIESSTLAARRQALTGLSAYRIHHYGFLTMIAPTPTLEHWLRKAKDIFGQFKSIQGNDSSKKTVLALGTWGSGIRSVWQSFKKLVERATEASFKADIVIMISSTNLLYNTSSCSAVPPNVITSRNPMYPSLETYSELVKASYPYSNKLIEVGLSMEFAANVYKLKREPKTIDDVNLYEPCIWHSIGSITVACRKRSSYKIVFEPETVLTMQDGAKDVVYMHDSQRTFNVKVKYIMRLQRWPHFAWLVYNVHMADITNRCNYRGPFYLLGDMKNAFRG